MTQSNIIKTLINELIYNNKNQKYIPDNFINFNIISPEYSPYEVEIKSYPQAMSKNLFALIWDIHKPHTVSSTIIPSET